MLGDVARKPCSSVGQIQTSQPFVFVSLAAPERFQHIRSRTRGDCHQNQCLQDTFDSVSREVDGPGCEFCLEEHLRFLIPLKGTAIVEACIGRIRCGHVNAAPFIRCQKWPIDLRSTRLAISRTHRSRVELFRFVDWVQLCGINRGHSAGRWSLPGDEGLVTSICLAVAIPVAAVGAVVAGVEERCGPKLGGRMTKRAVSLEQRVAVDGPFHQKLSNGQTLRRVVMRNSSIAVPMPSRVTSP